MKKSTVCGAAAVVALMLGGASAHAATLLYDMEGAPPPSGFGPNGGGVTVTQDTIGATQGTNSMKMSVVTGATFVGALTGVVAPGLTPPLPIEEIDFDYTLTSPFAGGFALVGITMFGFNAPAGQFGLQAQFADFIHLDGKAAGTYHAAISLASATNPLTFAAGQSYNQIFVSGTPDANHLNPSGLQFFLNKSNDAIATVYIDNVTLGPVPEPSSLALLAAGGLWLTGSRRRRA